MDRRKIEYLTRQGPGRRDFIRTSLFTMAAWPILIDHPLSSLFRNRLSFADYPFQLGVASGDPNADGFVIWTRLAPNPLEGGGMPDENVAVKWMVSKDEKMSQVVAEGEVLATPSLAHSVHVEVEGLQPDRWYFYQFQAGNEVSEIGRSRTMPARSVMADNFKFAFASCQHFETGYFTAYEHMVKEPLDLVIHLGDYIYEYKGKDDRVRKHLGDEIQSVQDYRQRISQYKMDPALKAVHAAYPWLVTWDDHEFDNNYANAVSEESGIDRVKFLQRRANAYQAYYEHMPLRKSSIPQGPYMKLYRKINCGRLLEFDVLDTRQYRSDQPCGDKSGVRCPDAFDDRTTMLGQWQERWLTKQLKRSDARWNVLAQQVMMACVDRKPGAEESYSVDQWPGYEASRKRLMEMLSNPMISNPVVLTGDIHANYANNLKVDYNKPEEASVAVEFVGTSISSGGDGKQIPDQLEGILSDNPFLKFHSRERGYVSCEVTPDDWKTNYRCVEYVSKRGAPLHTRASFMVQNGRRELIKV